MAGVHDAQVAQLILARLRAQPVDSIAVLQELDMMQLSSDESLAPAGRKPGLRQLLARGSSRRGLLICVACAVAQQLSGINNAFNFSSTFLTRNGIPPATVGLIAVLMNAGNVLVTLASVWLMDRAGRRALLTYSAVGMLVGTAGLTVALTSAGASWAPALAVLALVTFVASFGVGLGPVPWLLPAEARAAARLPPTAPCAPCANAPPLRAPSQLFPVDKCARGSAVAASCNWLANFVVGVSFMPMANVLQGACFLPSAAVLLAFVLLVMPRIPETRGKTLEAILAELGDGSATTSTSWRAL